MLYIDDSTDKHNRDEMFQSTYTVSILCRVIGLFLACAAYEVGAIGLYWLECSVFVMLIIFAYLNKSDNQFMRFEMLK